MSIDWLLICWFFGRKERKSSPREIFPSSFGLCSVDFHFILNGSDRAHFPRLASNMKLKAHDMQICPMHSSTKPFSLSSFKRNFRDSRGCLSYDRFDKFHFISRAEYPSAEMNFVLNLLRNLLQSSNISLGCAPWIFFPRIPMRFLIFVMSLRWKSFEIFSGFAEFKQLTSRVIWIFFEGFLQHLANFRGNFPKYFILWNILWYLIFNKSFPRIFFAPKASKFKTKQSLNSNWIFQMSLRW